MLRVRSESPDRIPLTELQDSIYYKQEKVFSDAEYAKCISLQRAVSKGQVLILEKKPEKDAGYVVPISTVEIVQPAQPIIPERPADGATPSTLDNTSIFEYLKSLEAKIDLIKSPGDNSGLVELLTQKIEALEKKIQNTPIVPAGSEGTMQKLEDILTRLSKGVSTKVASEEVKKEIEEIVPQEIYVPNVRVEDGNSHINLKIRTIESGDSVSSASEALRKLKEGK